MPHIHKLIDYTVALFIRHKNKVLLIHHKKLDRWLPPGGHIELDEDPDQGLFRELEEETGLKKGHFDLLTTKPSIDCRSIS